MAGLEGLLAGRVLGGRYLIEEVIGRGGMGVVYRALDERLGRRVAVKVITLVGGDPEGVERLRARFHREARAAAALPHHPNVVPVYDYGTDEALGLDYIVMELLHGQDLATRLARSDVPPLSTALRILVQAARGLAVGHRAGLIHRDVKPGNIFLSESDQRELQVRVVDFGIAKLADDEDTANQLTQDGRVPHSPAFASPEQLRGLSRLTAASDVFSLGAVGFVLLTGERPFSDADRNRMSLGMPAPPPPLRTTQPAIPAGVEVVVQKALSFDPAERYADAGEMLEALDEAIRGIAATPLEPYAGAHFEPPASRAPRRREPPPREPEDDRTLLAEGAAGAPAGSGAVGDDRTQLMDEDDRTLVAPVPPAPQAGTSPPPGPAGAPPPRAFPPRPPLQPKKRRVGLIVWTLVLLSLAAVAVWAWMESNRGVRVAEEIPAPPDTVGDLGAPVDVDPVEEPDQLDAFILSQEGVRMHRQGKYDSALVSFRLAVAVEPDNANYQRNLGITLFDLGEYEEAVAPLRRATALDPTLLIARFNLASALLLAGDTTASIEELDRFADLSSGSPDLVVRRNQAIAKAGELRRAQRAAERAAQDTLQPLPAPDTIAPVVPPGGF